MSMNDVDKPPIRLFFTDFWKDFNQSDNTFTRILSKDFNLIIDGNKPDILIYSCFGLDFLNYDCIRIFYTAENLAPKYKECDFSISYEYWADKRNLRLPYYVRRVPNLKDLLNKNSIKITNIIEHRKKFCSMVVSNPATKERNSFFHKLSKYKIVDSGGKHLNNIGTPVKDKHDFIMRYKFNLCFENSSHPGYTTEKIIQAMTANTIPIYWGNPLIHYEFNTRSFFNYFDYSSEDDLIADIIEHDKDPEKYFNKLMQPWFEEDVPNQYFDNQRIRKFLVDIIQKKETYTPVARNKFKKYFYFPVGYQVNRFLGLIKSI